MNGEITRDHERFARHDAAYVLGALDPHERQDFELHLRACPVCQAEVAEVADTAALLASSRMRADLSEVFADGSPSDEAPPDTLLPELLRAASRRTRRRRLVTAAAGVLAAACLVAVVVVLRPSGSEPRPTRPVTFVALQPNPVHVTAVLVAEPWGTSVRLDCRYAAGVTASLPYGLIVVDRQRRRHDAGAWTLVPGRTIVFTGGTDVARDQIVDLEITLADGTAILRATP